MIVVDTNILIYLCIPGDRTRDAEWLIEQDPFWVAPPLWRSEFRNAMAGHLRRQALNFSALCDVQADAEGFLTGSEIDVDSRLVFELVRDSDCTAYDCEFIALAMQLDTTLVTADKKRLRASPRYATALQAS